MNKLKERVSRKTAGRSRFRNILRFSCLFSVLAAVLLLSGCAGRLKADIAQQEPAVETAAVPEPSAPPLPPETPSPAPTPEPPVDFLIGEQRITGETDVIDLSLATEAEIGQLINALPRLHALETIIFDKDNAEEPKIPWETVLEIETRRPDVLLQYSFTIRGYRFDLQDEVLNLNHIRFEDEGALAVKIARCMPNLKLLDMDSCGVTDENMARIRDSFPDVKVVWRVFFGRAYSTRTDVERLMVSNPTKSGYNDLTNEALKGLYYCTKVKYLDLGHLSKVTDVGYVANMPDLEVLIIAMTAIKKIDALAACPRLNYLEFQTSAACDLTPLKGLSSLRDLNIAHDFALRDLTPIMDLELDRLYIGMFTPIPREQIEEYLARHPNCIINTTTPDPTEEGWRTVKGVIAPRYAQLRKEFQYDTNPLCYAYNENDRRYGWRFEY